MATPTTYAQIYPRLFIYPISGTTHPSFYESTFRSNKNQGKTVFRIGPHKTSCFLRLPYPVSSTQQDESKTKNTFDILLILTKVNTLVPLVVRHSVQFEPTAESTHKIWTHCFNVEGHTVECKKNYPMGVYTPVGWLKLLQNIKSNQYHSTTEIFIIKILTQLEQLLDTTCTTLVTIDMMKEDNNIIKTESVKEIMFQKSCNNKKRGRLIVKEKVSIIKKEPDESIYVNDSDIDISTESDSFSDCEIESISPQSFIKQDLMLPLLESESKDMDCRM